MPIQQIQSEKGLYLKEVYHEHIWKQQLRDWKPRPLLFKRQTNHSRLNATGKMKQQLQFTPKSLWIDDRYQFHVAVQFDTTQCNFFFGLIWNFSEWPASAY